MSPTKKPAKCCAFKGPSHRDPLSLELDWENQGDEKQRGAAEQGNAGVRLSVWDWPALEQHR
jgi:hypothetical protein